jgi:DNA uptake protein ComE-like DNA-binding protein
VIRPRITHALCGAALVAALTTPATAQVGKNSSGIIDPNLATKEQLAALPGLNAEIADAIIAGRPYLDMVSLDKVLAPKLDAEQRKALYAKLFQPINLNTATREEILLVPGVGERMAHEFEEYRPYRAMAQFRREIGKYVNEQEVARLEQYVFVPIDLNTATNEDILSIPGVGQRMLREFLEYRPYRSMEQFRREIGKYVDEKELARLERYVEIRPAR